MICSCLGSFSNRELCLGSGIFNLPFFLNFKLQRIFYCAKMSGTFSVALVLEGAMPKSTSPGSRRSTRSFFQFGKCPNNKCHKNPVCQSQSSRPMSHVTPWLTGASACECNVCSGFVVGMRKVNGNKMKWKWEKWMETKYSQEARWKKKTNTHTSECQGSWYSFVSRYKCSSSYSYFWHHFESLEKHGCFWK